MARIFKTNIDLDHNQLVNLVAEKLAADPATPAEARVIYNTVGKALKFWNGTAWVPLDGTASTLGGQNGAYYLSRANHTGTQLASTISDFSTAADARIAAAGYATDIGNGTLTAITVTHNLNTRDVLVKVRSNTTPWAYIEPDVEATDANTVTLRFTTAPTAAQYRAIVQAVS
jgi:hypothetical protein